MLHFMQMATWWNILSVGFHVALKAWIVQCDSGVIASASGLKKQSFEERSLFFDVHTLHTLRSCMHACMHAHHSRLTMVLFHCDSAVHQSPLSSVQSDLLSSLLLLLFT